MRHFIQMITDANNQISRIVEEVNGIDRIMDDDHPARKRFVEDQRKRREPDQLIFPVPNSQGAIDTAGGNKFQS